MDNTGLAANLQIQFVVRFDEVMEYLNHRNINIYGKDWTVAFFTMLEMLARSITIIVNC